MGSESIADKVSEVVSAEATLGTDVTVEGKLALADGPKAGTVGGKSAAEGKGGPPLGGYNSAVEGVKSGVVTH